LKGKCGRYLTNIGRNSIPTSLQGLPPHLSEEMFYWTSYTVFKRKMIQKSCGFFLRKNSIISIS